MFRLTTLLATVFLEKPCQCLYTTSSILNLDTKWLEHLHNNHFVKTDGSKSNYHLGLNGKEVLSNLKFELTTLMNKQFAVEHLHTITHSSFSPSTEECANVIRSFLKSKKVATGVCCTSAEKEVDLMILGKMVQNDTAEETSDGVVLEHLSWLNKFVRRSGNIKINHENNQSDIVYNHAHNICHLQQSKLFLISPENSLHILVTDLKEMTKAVLLDSLHYVRDGSEQIPLLRLHRRLVPVKMCILIEGSKNSTLEKLALELCYTIRAMNISCLLLDSATADEDHFHQLDGKGIYLSAILDEFTLNNGFIKLRNRDDSIKSPIHVSELQKYLFRLFK